MPSSPAMRFARSASREAIASTVPRRERCMPGMTFFVPMSAVEMTPQRIFRAMKSPEFRQVAAGWTSAHASGRGLPAVALPPTPYECAAHEVERAERDADHAHDDKARPRHIVDQDAEKAGEREQRQRREDLV